MVKQQRIWLFIAVYTLVFAVVSTLTRNITLIDAVTFLTSTIAAALTYVIYGYAKRYDIFTWFLAVLMALLTVFVLRLLFIAALLHTNGTL